MGRLKTLDTYDFMQWVKRSGFTDEMDFWSGLSGLTRGSVTDHMVHYLNSLGYVGTPNDQMAAFLKDQVGLIGGREGTLYDMANEMFGVDSGAYSNVILDESGLGILDEDGNPIEEE